jgi:hypothetical protein
MAGIGRCRGDNGLYNTDKSIVLYEASEQK